MKYKFNIEFIIGYFEIIDYTPKVNVLKQNKNLSDLGSLSTLSILLPNCDLFMHY